MAIIRRVQTWQRHVVVTAISVALIAPMPVVGGDIRVREITRTLARARPGSIVVLAGQDLSFLDLCSPQTSPHRGGLTSARANLELRP